MSSRSERRKDPKKDECGTFYILRGNGYSDFKKIGSGAYGVVCSATDVTTGGKVAIKRVHPWADDEWDARHTLRELRLMRLLSAHPNILTLTDVALCSSNDLFIVMELMESDLHHIITSKQVLTCAHVSCLTAQLFLGLQAMHGLGMLHRDLKPGNLLVSRGCELRITDFGLSRYIDEMPRPDDDDDDSDATDEETDDDEKRQRKKKKKKVPLTEYVVTRWYRCPEVLLAPHLPYSTAVDCWSAGCIFAELIRRKPLFQGKNFVHQVQVILERLGTPDRESFGFKPRDDAARFLAKQPYHKAPGLATLLPTATAAQITFAKRLLTFNPRIRASVDEALLDDFFNDMPELPGRSQAFFPRRRRPSRREDDVHPETTDPQEASALIAFRDAVLADDGFEFGFEHPDTSLEDLRSAIHDDIHRVQLTRRIAQDQEPKDDMKKNPHLIARLGKVLLPNGKNHLSKRSNQIDGGLDDDDGSSSSRTDTKISPALHDDANLAAEKRDRKALPRRSKTAPVARRWLPRL